MIMMLYFNFLLCLLRKKTISSLNIAFGPAFFSVIFFYKLRAGRTSFTLPPLSQSTNENTSTIEPINKAKLRRSTPHALRKGSIAMALSSRSISLSANKWTGQQQKPRRTFHALNGYTVSAPLNAPSVITPQKSTLPGPFIPRYFSHRLIKIPDAGNIPINAKFREITSARNL